MPPKPPESAAETETSTTADVTKMAGDVAAIQDQAIQSMSKMGLAWVEGMSDLGSEVLSLVANRIKEDVKTQHKLLHCKDVDELQTIQAEFMQTAIDQYTAETGKLVQMSQDLYVPQDTPETKKS